MICIPHPYIAFSGYKTHNQVCACSFPGAACTWVNVLERAQWSGADERKRRRINLYGRQQVRLLTKGSALDLGITFRTPALFRPDGIHLSNEGLDVYLDKIKVQLLSHI